jgi:hypothetical protein
MRAGAREVGTRVAAALAALVVLTIWSVTLATAPQANASTPSPVTFNYNGKEQTYKVPAGVVAVQVLALGANGGTAGGAPRTVGRLGLHIPGT